MATTPGPVAKTSGGNNAFHNFHNDFAHIADPNERRRLALAEIDKAPFGWYHVRACIVAGVGFFTDSYDIFCVSMLTIMLGIVESLLLALITLSSFRLLLVLLLDSLDLVC
ncbi:hypothetical protein LB505_005676 [Fusarium chuoi]|nr:hypothetical protein LB505_005676 [Fusarium chuoi]